MNHTDRLQLKTRPQRILARAFTLIEILIVIALTAVLFALLLVPLVSALRYTQQAQIVTAAQDAARTTKERIARELGSAIFVFTGTSHPFVLPPGKMIAPGDDAYTNFLDLQILNSTGGAVVAHAYSAKLDFVLPLVNTGTVLDPTTQESINYAQSQNGSAIISNPSYVFPLAAGTNMVRYFVGLKDPTLSYNNTREGTQVSGIHRSDDNTYILYRAEFQPYTPVKNNAGVVTGTAPNTNLFATTPKLDASGQPVKDANGKTVLIPEIDDPDFFRYVSTSDVNWLNATHVVYTSAEVTAHNARVDKWIQISKSVIPGPNVDLLLLPHNADNTLNYDLTGGPFPGVAHSGVALDPVTNNTPYPIVNTSCTFRPATVSGNATPGTTSDYNSQGTVAMDQNGFSYIPTVYTATSQSWSLPYHVTVSPDAAAGVDVTMYSYDTDQFAGAPVTTTLAVSSANPAPVINTGDLIEYLNNKNGRVPVFDVTQGFNFTVMGTTYTAGMPAGKEAQYVPMTVNSDTGTISFAAPSLPNGPSDRFARTWYYTPVADVADSSLFLVDLTQPGYTDQTLGTANPNPSPLTNATVAASGPPTGTDDAHPVPGSVRVYGPDQTSGPNSGRTISYTEINTAVGTSATGAISDNQYAVDYAHNVVELKSGATGPIQVIYDYQANMTLTTPPGTSFPVDLTRNPYLPMGVKVDYQTRDLIDVSIGVRIYDVTNNRAQVIPAETKIKVGNSNR